MRLSCNIRIEVESQQINAFSWRVLSLSSFPGDLINPLLIFFFSSSFLSYLWLHISFFPFRGSTVCEEREVAEPRRIRSLLLLASLNFVDLSFSCFSNTSLFFFRADGIFHVIFVWQLVHSWNSEFLYFFVFSSPKKKTRSPFCSLKFLRVRYVEELYISPAGVFFFKKESSFSRTLSMKVLFFSASSFRQWKFLSSSCFFSKASSRLPDEPKLVPSSQKTSFSFILRSISPVFSYRN